MTIRSALAECPEGVIVPPDPVLYRARWEGILTALGSISPEVEDEAPGSAYLNVRGLSHLYRDEEALAAEIVAVVRQASGLDAAVGVSEGRLPARAVAMTLSTDTRVIAAGCEAAFLSQLSIDLFPFDAHVLSRLRMFGLTTMGDVAALSIPDLQSQFGFEGKRMWELANGIDTEPLCPRPAVEQLVDSLSFEVPVAGIDILVAGAKQLFSRLIPSLRGRATRELTLEAELTSGRGWERHLVLREAVSETDRLIFVLRSALENAPPPMAVHTLSLRLAGLTGETGKQMSLGERGRLQRQLEDAIQQLKVRYGYSPVSRCVDVEPWSVVPEDRQILVESDG
jgi:nucleotidyltransferase/DNA polymerase involved in DNA repair